MEVKMFEVRDARTFIPVLCVLMRSGEEHEYYLLRRLGFSSGSHLVQLVWMGKEQTQWDPHKWNDRTMFTAHKYITENWQHLATGTVIDVEWILGEREIPKQSERLS